MSLFETPTHKQAPIGLDRRSCAWLDAVGSGYVTGPTERVLQLVSHQTQSSYCPNRVEDASIATPIDNR